MLSSLQDRDCSLISGRCLGDLVGDCSVACVIRHAGWTVAWAVLLVLVLGGDLWRFFSLCDWDGRVSGSVQHR